MAINETVTRSEISTELRVEEDLATFNQTAFRTELATLYQV